jgi:hypothetical protein
MKNSSFNGKIEIVKGPPGSPYAKIYIEERRRGQKDRRRLPTFVANDRRSGIADRRE